MKNELILKNDFPILTDFNAYKRYVLNIPQLNEKEERLLLEDLHNHNSISSAQKLIVSQLKTVLNIARQYKNYGIAEEDLVQEGNIGLMKAVKNYDLNHKVRLYSYALLWIKSEIQNYILKNWKIVKIGTTKNLKKLFFNYRQIQKEMLNLGVPKTQLENIVAEKLSVSKEEVRDIEQYFGNNEIVVDSQEIEDSPTFQLVDDNSPDNLFEIKHDTAVRENVIKSALKELKDRQKQVLEYRYFNETKKTHKEISEIIKVSSERVRQIENEAIEELKKILKVKFNITNAF